MSGRNTNNRNVNTNNIIKLGTISTWITYVTNPTGGFFVIDEEIKTIYQNVTTGVIFEDIEYIHKDFDGWD